MSDKVDMERALTTARLDEKRIEIELASARETAVMSGSEAARSRFVELLAAHDSKAKEIAALEEQMRAIGGVE